MVSKKTLHAHRFSNMNNWYERISESSGSLEAVEMIEQLSKPQGVEFLNWLNRRNPANKQWMTENVKQILKR